MAFNNFYRIKENLEKPQKQFKLEFLKSFMVEGYVQDNWGDINSKARDIEEKQRMQKERIMLLEKNLIELKVKNSKENLELKKELQIISQNMAKLTRFLETASIEMGKFARIEDLELLTKQAKMFQPLDFVRREELDKLKRM